MIRIFNRKDLTRILEIEKDSFPKEPYECYLFLQYHRLFPDNFLLYIDDYSKKILGYIIFRPDGHIISIAVDKAFRRKGIGNELVHLVNKLTNGKGKVEVRRSNKNAQSLYTKNGFIRTGIIPNYCGDEAAVIMECKINTK